MVTKTEQKQLKIIFGAYYTEDVFNILHEAGITNRNGELHTQEYIRKVFQGLRENKDIEKAIWMLALRKKEEAKTLKQQKKLILQK